jgi:hypothetical protein
MCLPILSRWQLLLVAVGLAVSPRAECADFGPGLALGNCPAASSETDQPAERDSAFREDSEGIAGAALFVRTSPFLGCSCGYIGRSAELFPHCGETDIDTGPLFVRASLLTQRVRLQV